MNDNKDTTLAFPRPDFHSDTHFTAPAQEGMMLRDYFAAAALSGICAQGDYGKHPKHKDGTWAASMAAHAYDYADAMMEARRK